jgi:hypothetical protein
MLSNFALERIAKKLELPIVGVFSKDELKERPRILGSYYINLMDSDKTDGEGNNGSHWVFAKIYSDNDRDSEDSDSGEDVKDCKALYFDPYGCGMPKDVSNFLKPFSPVYCNNRQIQNINTSQCGWYCVLCDYMLEHKQDGKTYLKDFEKFLNLWYDEPEKNLTVLKRLFKPV